VIFQELGVRWEYEPEGYVVRGKCYLPDFWIEEWNAWFEVKPMSEQHKMRSLVSMLQQLRRDTRARHAYVCFGAPDLIRGSRIFDDQCAYEWVNEFGPVCESPSEGVAYEAYRIAMEERFEAHRGNGKYS
jgi:hypothetical protein